MTNRGKYAFVFLLIGLFVLAGVGVGWWAFSRLHAPGAKVVLRGSSGSSGRLKVSGGNLVVVTPRPGVFFGTVKKPDAPEQFTYVILFRYGPPKSDGPRATASSSTAPPTPAAPRPPTRSTWTASASKPPTASNSTRPWPPSPPKP